MTVSASCPVYTNDNEECVPIGLKGMYICFVGLEWQFVSCPVYTNDNEECVPIGLKGMYICFVGLE